MRLLYPLLLVALAASEPVQFSDTQTGLATTLSLLQNGSNTDIHMQMWGPKSAGWNAIGIGQQMADALMFVMYPSSSGQAVTLSARTAEGHVMPQADHSINLQVTNSSISEQGIMMAEFICYGCTTWPTGGLSTSSSSSSFLYAMGPGKSIQSDSQDAPISQHQQKGVFIGNVANAYTSPSDTVTSQPQTSPAASDTKSVQQPSPEQIKAHAILLCLVFFGFMPTAVILLRLPFTKGAAFHLHWILQVFAFFVAIAGLGIAVNFSLHSDRYKNFSYFHQIIGLVTISMLLIQAIAGSAHHWLFKKQNKRSVISYAHIALGWMLIILGMLNGCFGLWLTEMVNASGGLGAAGIVILLTMLAVSIMNQLRRNKDAKGAKVGGKTTRESSSVEDSEREK